MLKTLHNLEINKVVEFKEFIEVAMDGIEELSILDLSADDIINILQYYFDSKEDFACCYVMLKSKKKDIFYLEKNTLTNIVDIKEEYKLTMNDTARVSIFFNLISEAYSIDDAKEIINDLDSALYKHFHYENAKEQLHLYYKALKYGNKALIKINSMERLYSMFY